MVPHLCCTLESANGVVAGRVRGGLAALLSVCASGTPAAQAAAPGVLRNLMVFLDHLPAFRDEGGAVRGGGTDRCC